MFKFITAVMASLMLLSTGCVPRKPAPAPAPEVKADGLIHVGSQRIITINCGQVCAVLYDDENNNFVALMEDGSKVVFDINE